MTKTGRTVASYPPLCRCRRRGTGRAYRLQDARIWVGMDNAVCSNSGNWNPQALPDTTAEDAVSNGTDGTVIDVDGTFTVNRVFLNACGVHTLNNGTLLLNNFTNVLGSTVNTNFATAGGFSTVQIKGRATTTLTGDLFTDNAGGAAFRLAPISDNDVLDVNGVPRDGTAPLSLLTQGTGRVGDGNTLEVNGAAGNAFADDSTVNRGSNATLRLVNSGEKIFRTSGSSTATVDLNCQTLTVGGATGGGIVANISGAGTLRKEGAGEIQLQVTNDMTGSVVVAEGALTVRGRLDNASAFMVDSGATLRLSNVNGSKIGDADDIANAGDETVGTVSGAGDINLAVGTLILSGDGDTATISGNGALAKTGDGTLTLSGENTYTGETTVTGGTLTVTGSILSEVITVDNERALSVGATALSNTAHVTLNDTSDLTLTADETIGSLASLTNFLTATLTLGSNTLTMFDADSDFNRTGNVVKQGNGTFTTLGPSDANMGTLFNEAGTTEIAGTRSGAVDNAATLNVTGTVTNGIEVATVADGTVTDDVTGAGAGDVVLTGTGAVNGAVSNSANVTLSDTSAAGSVSNSTTVNLADTSAFDDDVTGFTTLNLDTSNAAGVGGNVTGTTLNVATQDTAADAAVGGDVSVDTLNFGDGADGFLGTAGSLTATGAATAQSAVMGFDIAAVGGQMQTNGVTVSSFTAPTNPTTLKFEVNEALTGRGVDVSGEYVVIDITSTDPTNALNPANFVLDAANIAKSGEDSLGGALLVASLTNGSGAPGTVGGAEDLVLQFQVDPAITAIGGQIATVQNLLGGVIKRPSSPLIAALAFDAADNESNGLWFRAQGGSAEVTSSTTNGTSNLPSTVDATYGGFQFGFDSGRFNAFDGGEDLVAGGFAGALQGSTEAENFNIDPNNPQQLGTRRGDVTKSEFDQVYVGGYLAYASGLFSGDIQLRFEHTDFTFDHPVIDLNDAETSAQSVTLSASGNYVVQVTDNVFIVPTGGAAITRSETSDLTFTDGGAQPTGTLSFEDHLSTIAFLGATAGYQSISAGGGAATTSFVTATVYDDFSDPRESLFSIGSSGLEPTLLETENLGTFGEVSVGVNHVRVLDGGGEGAPRQLNAGIRLDTRFSDRIDAYNVTAQARFQF